MRRCFLAIAGTFLSVGGLGCGEPPSSSSSYTGPPLSSAAVVLLNNLQVSGLGRIEVDGRMIEAPDIALGTDPALATSREKYFALVRDQSVVHEFDPATLLFTRKFVPYEKSELTDTKVLPCKLEVSGINPQDAAFDADGRLWVTRYERPTVAILEPDGSFSGTVDLSAFADADGVPEAMGVHVAGDRVYVALERLDRCGGWLPSGPGQIVEIDVATRTVVKSIELGGGNPFGRLVPAPWDSSGNTVIVALPGDPRHIDDGDAVAMIDLATGVAKGFLRETDLGGSVSEAILAAPDEAYVIVLDSNDPVATPTSVLRVNPETGEVKAKVLDSHSASNPGGGYCHRGLAVVGEHVLVGSKEPCDVGVVVVDRASVEQVGVIRPAKLPPIAIQASP